MKNEQSAEQLVNSVYSRYWQREKVHGPDEARTSLARRVKPELVKLSPSDVVIDLGAGRQAMERQVLRNWRRQIDCRFVTFDIAELKSRQLLKRGNVQPVRGNGAYLPFGDATFSVALSSMGLELMPAEAISELARVIKGGGKAFLNVLHPSVSSWKRDDLLKPNPHGRKNDQQYADFWSHYARENNVFGKGDETIRGVMQEFGFDIDRIETVSSHNTSWIEIDATRNEVPYGGTVVGHINGISAISALEMNEPHYLVDTARLVAHDFEMRLKGYEDMNA